MSGIQGEEVVGRHRRTEASTVASTGEIGWFLADLQGRRGY